MIDRFPSPHCSRRALIGSLVAGAALPRLTRAQDATPGSASEAARDWPVEGGDLAGTRAVADPAISSTNVTALQPAWQLDLGSPATGTPIIASGRVFLGGFDGTLRAIELKSGQIAWTYDTGAAVRDETLGIDLGILASATSSDGTVYVGDATATLHAIDAETGKARWKKKIDEQPTACIRSSPVVVDGLVYIGIDSVAPEVGFRGSFVALAADTGEERWRTFTVDVEADGGGVAASPAVDPARGVIFVATGHAFSSIPAPYGNPISVLALDLATGEERWVFNAPPGGAEEAPTEDVGFTAGPNLFSARIFGQPRDLLGIGQKSGLYWLLDRNTGEFIWRTQIGSPGPLGGVAASAAIAPNRIIVPASDWPNLDETGTGLIVALDPATGKVLWTTDQSAPALTAVTVSGDLAFHAGTDGRLRALSLQSGQELWHTDLGTSASTGIAIAGDTQLVAAASAPIAPAIQPGTTLFAFSLNPAPSATPAVGDGTSR